MSSRGGGGGRGRGGGRGEYYRNKYGGGGRGRGDGSGGGGRGGGGRGGRGRGRGSASESDSQQQQGGGGCKGGDYDDLTHLLQNIDGKQYPAYHDLETAEHCGWKYTNQAAGLDFTLQIGRAQSDPFAPPTRCRVVIPVSASRLPETFFSNKIRRMATGDFLWRQLYRNCRAMGADNTLANNGYGNKRGGGTGWSGPKGGDIQVMEPVQHVMEQSAVQIGANGTVVAQITLNLPARGRSILGLAARDICGTILPRMIQDSLVYTSIDALQLTHHVDSVQDQLWLQDQLDDAGLVAFVRNGAILPRVSGAADNDLPMAAAAAEGTGVGAIPFQSPANLQVSFALPVAGTTVTGMGIRKGVTLICGGGFHGKSTLLQTLQLGVYSKIPGDGREFCVTSARAMKIRAEDGRCVKSVDISPFINNLPFGRDTKCFSTLDASGSTSQATNIVEVSMRC
jgi:predicted ABC-class ATPase